MVDPRQAMPLATQPCDAAASGRVDDHLHERTLRSEVVYQGHFLRVQRDVVALPDGREAVREYVRHPGAVMIVPLLPDGRLVLERQYRHPVGRVMIEFPAGKLDPGESGLACAQRELLEETGYRARRWARAGVMHPVIGYADEFIEVWFADELTAGERHLDEGEFLDVLPLTQQALEDAVRDGLLTDVKTVYGLMWLSNWRAGRWPLTWQSL